MIFHDQTKGAKGDNTPKSERIAQSLGKENFPRLLVEKTRPLFFCAPEFGRFDDLDEDERVEDDDGGVGDQLDQEELRPGNEVSSMQIEFQFPNDIQFC